MNLDIILTEQECTSLLRCPLLLGADTNLINQILCSQHTSTLPFQHGEVIYTPNHFQRALGILLSGSLQVRREDLPVSALSVGDLFGAAALYSDDADYTATLTGGESGRILLLDFPLVDGLMATSPLVRENYLRYLTGRIRFLSGRLHSVAAGDGEGKLARYLLSNPDISCSATELAGRLGMGRATLYRAFQHMETTGAIARSGRTISVLDSKLLHSFT